MKTRSTPFLVLGMLSTFTLFAQKQANHWFFGLNAGLDFTNGAPVADTGSIYTSEGCSSISDANGSLLFYTDGITVYDRRDSAMANSGNLMGSETSTQSGLIVPDPGNANQYYIFTTDADGGPNGFRYSIVDMTLNGGLGDVSGTKNVLVKNNVTEKLSALSNYNGTGYWVMIHEWTTDAFYAYQLTSAGLNNTPVVSHVGMVHTDSFVENTTGYLKFSHSGKKLAVAIGYQKVFQLFDFNDSSGVVSNSITLPGADRDYGVEFSPDDSKLYVTRYNLFYDMYYLDQYDLSSNDSATIVASQYNVSTADVMRALQLGPDKKIYVAKAYQPFLAVINNPDSLQAACNFADNAVSLDINSSALGLPGFVQSIFRGGPRAAFASTDTTICPGTCVDFQNLSLNQPTSWQWHFQGATPDTSTSPNPQHICYPLSGNYNVTLIVSNAGGSDTLILQQAIRVRPQPSISITVTGDTMQVLGQVAYQWYSGNNPIPNATGNTYVAPAPGFYSVQVTDSAGCTAISNPVEITTTGIAQLQLQHGLYAYPVPATDYVNVYLPASWKTGQLRLANLLGQEVALKIQSVLENKATIDLQELPTGYYLLKYQADAEVKTALIIKN